MDRYPASILRSLSDLCHATDSPADGSTTGVAADFNCGASVTVSLAIDASANRIDEVAFKSSACGYALAFAEHVAGFMEGRTPAELGGGWQVHCYEAFISEVGPVESVRMPCLAMVADAFGEALRAYRLTTVSKFEGESPLICSCFGVSEDVLQKILDEGGASTVSELTQMTNAGSGCGSCLMVLSDLVETHGS